MVDNVLVDAAEGSGNLSDLEKDLSEAVSSRKTPSGNKPAVKKEDNVEDDGLPPKLKGKTPQEIAAMYVNLESAYGRMANDLGTQRKMTDRLLDLKRDTDLNNNGQPAKVEIKSSELLENPTEALERFSQAREAQSNSRLADMERRLAAQAFVAAHPDYQAYENNAEFTQWITSAPSRARVAAAAANGDWSAAADLLTEFKSSRKAVEEDEVADDEADARKAAKKASLESGSQGTAGAKKGGKVYKRADLMRLRAEKPDVWADEEFQAEIIRAYNEGRVK